MSKEEKIFRINLPTLFERVNEHRRERGMPEVEPAIMAVRASIRFAIRQQKEMDFKVDKVDMDGDDTGALCQALGELFNVELNVDENAGIQANSTVTTPTKTLDQDLSGDDETCYVLPMSEYYASINRERRAKWLQSAEPAVISVRTGIKFSIMRRRTLNFRENKLILSEADLRVLDQIVEQQFDVSLAGGLRSLCTVAPSTHNAAGGTKVPGKGVLSRLFGGLMGKSTDSSTPSSHHHHTQHYSLDTSNLLLSIITRRAYLGHKPMKPDLVKDRCGKALSADLELEVDMDDENIALSPEQLDTFAEIIRNEFEIMFDDLDELLGKKPNK
jgi:hypothetical protein